MTLAGLVNARPSLFYTCVSHVRIEHGAMDRVTRTYTIALGPSQDAIDVHVADSRHRLALAWYLMPCGERQTTYLDLDTDDEREIISAALSSDRRRLIVVVDCDPNSKPQQVRMNLSDFLPEKSRALLEQADVQMAVQQSRSDEENPKKIHWCFTETRDVLNSK